MSEDSDARQLDLMRLAEQAAKIAEQLQRMAEHLGQAANPPEASGNASAFRLDEPASHDAAETDRIFRRSTRPPLPDPKLVRRILNQRQLRARFFGSSLLADPAWDMLLDLTAARAEHARVSVTSLCIASGVPPTTALRWITQLVEAGLVERVEDEIDHRRAFVMLTDRAANAMAQYFSLIGGGDNGRVRVI